MRFFLLFFSIVTLVFSDVTLTKEEKLWLKKNKQINLCVDPDWMPFEKIDTDGNYIGIVADYQKLIFHKLGITFKVVATQNYSQSKEFLKNGNCDVISADVPTQENKKDFLLTQVYYVIPRAFATHVDTP
jgi:polar amino acid transport system substrate-binding protein